MTDVAKSGDDKGADDKTGTVLDDAKGGDWMAGVDARFKDDKGAVNAQAIYKSWSELNTQMSKVGKPPEAPDKYDFKLPDGYTLDEAKAKEFRGKAHAEGLTNKQYGFVMSELIGAVDGAAEAALASALGTPETCKAELQKVWGADYDRQLGAAKKFAETYGLSKDTLKVIGNIPEVVQVLAKAGAEIGEDQGVHGGRGSEAVDVDALMRDPAYLNPMHPEHAAVKAKVYAARGLSHLLT